MNYENNIKNATSLKSQFENWYLAMPALSFYGSKYDINFFIDKYIDRSDFELLEMDSNYFLFSEDSIEKLIKPKMKEEYEKDKCNFLPSESQELHPTFNVDGVKITWAQYDKRKTGLCKVETTKHKMIS